jgi:NAD(P)-dependent dehydrogenase (short-subunit alcohol dehydrogenase family)
MMVATMTLEIAATEFVHAAATRFAYRRLGPATVTRLAAAVALRFAARGEGAIVNISSILAPGVHPGIYGANESPTKSAERSTNSAFETIPRGRWKGYCDEKS